MRIKRSIIKLVAKELLKTPLIRPYVALDEWTIMPDHVHVIFHIDPTKIPQAAESEKVTDQVAEATQARLLKNSLGSMLGQIKSICTKEIRAYVNADFAWQPRYHDVIIHNEKQLENTRRYIRQNITNWAADEPE